MYYISRKNFLLAQKHITNVPKVSHFGYVSASCSEKSKTIITRLPVKNLKVVTNVPKVSYAEVPNLTWPNLTYPNVCQAQMY